jgi:preprotein translocase subunit SecB
LCVYFKEAFKRNLPQSPIKLLNQLRPTGDIDMNTRKVELEEDALCYYEVVLRVDGHEFIGKGDNKSLAKKGAFKRAVRAIQKLQKPGSPKYIFF